jgi:hypothetical protein
MDRKVLVTRGYISELQRKAACIENQVGDQSLSNLSREIQFGPSLLFGSAPVADADLLQTPLVKKKHPTMKDLIQLRISVTPRERRIRKLGSSIL